MLARNASKNSQAAHAPPSHFVVTHSEMGFALWEQRRGHNFGLEALWRGLRTTLPVARWPCGGEQTRGGVGNQTVDVNLRGDDLIVPINQQRCRAMDEGPEPKSDLLRIAAYLVALAVERDLLNEMAKAFVAGVEHVLGLLKRGLLTEHQSKDRRLLDREGNVGLPHRDDRLQGAFALCGHGGPRFSAQL